MVPRGVRARWGRGREISPHLDQILGGGGQDGCPSLEKMNLGVLNYGEECAGSNEDCRGGGAPPNLPTLIGGNNTGVTGGTGEGEKGGRLRASTLLPVSRAPRGGKEGMGGMRVSQGGEQPTQGSLSSCPPHARQWEWGEGHGGGNIRGGCQRPRPWRGPWGPGAVLGARCLLAEWWGRNRLLRDKVPVYAGELPVAKV